jgi:hypothetical protein
MYRITGPRTEIEKIKAEIGQDLEEISIVKHKDIGTSSRTAYGMEPFAYLIVVFVGHLAAAVAHDQLKYLIHRYSKSTPKVSVEEEKDIDKDDDADLL